MKSAPIGRETANFGTALSRYLRLISTLLWRENAIRRHAPLETVLGLLEPVLLIGLITAGRYFLDRLHAPPFGTSIILFYATGFIADYFFIYLSRRMGGQIQSPARRFPVEQRLDHIIVYVILRIIDFTILSFLVLGSIYLFSTTDAWPHNFAPIVQAAVQIIMLGFGWGIINFVIARIFWPWAYISPVLNRGLALFSGAFFVPDFLPPDARYILSFNPMLHAIALFRQGFYPNYPQLLFDGQYLFAWAICSVLAGLVLERITRRSEGQ